MCHKWVETKDMNIHDGDCKTYEGGFSCPISFLKHEGLWQIQIRMYAKQGSDKGY